MNAVDSTTRVRVEIDAGLCLRVSENLAQRLQRIGIVRHMSSGRGRNESTSSVNDNVTSASSNGVHDYGKCSDAASTVADEPTDPTQRDNQYQDLLPRSRIDSDSIEGCASAAASTTSFCPSQDQVSDVVSATNSVDEEVVTRHDERNDGHPIGEEAIKYKKRARRSSSLVDHPSWLHHRAFELNPTDETKSPKSKCRRRFLRWPLRSRDDIALNSSRASSDDDASLSGDPIAPRSPSSTRTSLRTGSSSPPPLCLHIPRVSRNKDNLQRTDSLRKKLLKKSSTSASPKLSPTRQVTEESQEMLCQNSSCDEGGASAAMVCHHSNCQDGNDHNPLLLCDDCDQVIHADSPESGHLRFDLFPGRNNSMPGKHISGGVGSKSDDDYDEEDEDDENGNDDDDDDGDAEANSVQNTRLKRKKALKGRRHHTESSLGMEYFTLRFDLTTEKDIEIVAAVKGVNLRNAILQACEKRGLNIESLCVYLASSKTPLPLEADTFPLGGNNLNVRVKDGEQAYIHRSGSTISLAPGKRPVEKKQAGSQRSKKNFPGLDEPPVNDANAYGTLRNMERSRPPKPQSKLSTLFNPFTKGQEKQEQLGSLLNEYSTRGWPEMPELLTLGTKHYSDSQFQLEEHWTGFVDDKESLSKSQKDHQEALWELLYTEVDYIKKVKVIIDLFMACLYNLQNESIFNEIKTEMVFSNVLDVYQANCSLWVDYMLPVIEKARSIKHPINASLLKEGFAKFERILQPYTKYCLEYESCKEYIRKSREKNELFDKFLMWAESHEQCSRLKLEDLIVFPWQRLTKYHLLLKAIRKPVDISENEKLCNDLDDMTEKVEQFGIQVNRVMRQRLENERLSSIIDRIEAYDAIDAPNEECLKMISEFTKVESFLRGQLPGCGSQEYRQLIREGPIKLKDTYSRMDVYVFLFTDMLLITKSIRKGDKVKVIKPPMRLDKVVVHILRDGGSFLLLHLNEYSTASAVYTLHGDSAKSWLEVIKKAQAEYAKKRNQAMSRTESSVLDFTINENEESDFSSSYHPHTYQTGNGDRSPDSLTRQNSTGSVESFIPSMGLPRSSSCGGEIDSDCREGNASRPRAATYSTDPRSRTPQFLFPRHSSSDNNLESRAAGKSPPNSPINFRQQRDMECQTHISYSDSLPEVKMDTHPGEATIAQPSNLDKLLLTQQPDLVYDENLRRLNQRRSSRGEKRYHTADAIQDMQKDKDASIHKRLSWNFGATVDISIEERASGLRGMPFNSDSLRSIPSSSGVSSQGSLHLTPESDICEEIESEVVPSTSNNDHPKQRTDPEPHIDNKTNSSTHSSEQSQTDNPNLANSNSSSLSKSSPDICDLYSKLNINSTEVQDGIGSVEISTGTKNQNKKMSQSQLLRVKKKLLLSNSTVEASEV